LQPVRGSEDPINEDVIFRLLIDLHRDGPRQGPGSDAETLRALELTRLDHAAGLKVADIGCGTGASALLLARQLPAAEIVAVDLFPEFLEVLAERAQAAGLAGRIETLAASMDALPFEPESLDLIWSEGAIYNIGFAAGLAAWRPFLRPGGLLAVSEITWLAPDPPEEIRQHWEGEYPEIATAAAKVATLEQAGYDLVGFFVLPESCWLANYYEPIEERLAAFLERQAGSPEAAEIAAGERREIDLYRRYREWFSYGFYVARRR
jgi:SAM-dependent methyltransferase